MMNTIHYAFVILNISYDIFQEASELIMYLLLLSPLMPESCPIFALGRASSCKNFCLKKPSRKWIYGKMV